MLAVSDRERRSRVGARKQEVFCFGGDSVNGFLELLARLNRANQYSSILSLMQRDPKIQARAMAGALADNLDLLKIPDLVIGSLRRQSVSEIWNGPEMDKFRNFLRRGRSFAICGKCCRLYE